MIKTIRAMVNGREMKLTVRKSYDNGREMVYECTNADGVWVAVEERTIIRPASPVRTSYEYAGDRTGECRVAFITLTGRSEEDVQKAYNMLCDMATDQAYDPSRCSNVEPHKRGFSIAESFHLVDTVDNDYFKREIYKRFKEQIAG